MTIPLYSSFTNQVTTWCDFTFKDVLDIPYMHACPCSLKGLHLCL
jgi:hypothetical protein